MPIYEYKCKKCGHGFEELVLSKEASITCPSCKSGRVEKGLSTFGVGSSSHSPCGSEACDLSGPVPPCASGACPSCLN